jgi:hypothetical protein
LDVIAIRRTNMPEEKICFVIAPIGEPESDVRKRSDQVLRHIISPSVERCGYKALRADQIAEPGIITNQVIQHILDDPLVVADLTGRNPNVFYELAIRHAYRKPVIQIIRKGEQIPFDVAVIRTIQVDHQDLDSVEQAKQELIRQAQSLAHSPEIDTPISISRDLQLLSQSPDPDKRSLGDLLSQMAEIRTSISNLLGRVTTPEALLPPSYIRNLLDVARQTPGKESLSRANHAVDQSRMLLKSFDALMAGERDELRSPWEGIFEGINAELQVIGQLLAKLWFYGEP